jgi:SAM-dependent methyltransferase
MRALPYQADRDPATAPFSEPTVSQSTGLTPRDDRASSPARVSGAWVETLAYPPEAGAAIIDGMPDPPSADSARARNRALFEGAFGEIYGLYIERERLARGIAELVWGADIRPFYASMGAIGEVPDGGVIVDVPCGAGVAFRGLRADQDVRYIAIDLSPRMLERARRRATRLGLGEIELVEGDAQSIPVEAASLELFLSYWGLHCFPNPAQAVAEAARCLRPGGRIVGCTIIRGRSWRHRLLVQPGRGGFGPGGTAEDLRRWLVDARLENMTVESSGLFAYFEAVKSR